MGETLAELSTKDFESLIEHTIDRRLEIWLTQVMDSLTGNQEQDEVELRPEFSGSLRHSLKQARSGKGLDLKTFREQVGR